MYSALPPAGLKFSTPLQLSPTRKTTLTSQSSVSPVSPKSAPANLSWGYHLDIVSALQGSNEYDYRTRAQIASSTKDLDDVAKTALIDFLASEELEYVLDEENVDSLVELWNRTHTLILPTIYGMLYPLEQFDPGFRVRNAMLRYFRDRVLTPVLRRMDYSTEILPKLKPILLAVDFDTQESSFAYLAFDKILRRLLDIDGGGSDDETETQRSEDVVEEEAELDDGLLSSPALGHMKNSRFSAPNHMCDSAEEEATPTMARKIRSRTMPSKAVHWDTELVAYDDESTVDV